jgi:hypothetical protein
MKSAPSRISVLQQKRKRKRAKEKRRTYNSNSLVLFTNCSLTYTLLPTIFMQFQEAFRQFTHLNKNLPEV